MSLIIICPSEKASFLCKFYDCKNMLVRMFGFNYEKRSDTNKPKRSTHQLRTVIRIKYVSLFLKGWPDGYSSTIPNSSKRLIKQLSNIFYQNENNLSLA